MEPLILPYWGLVILVVLVVIGLLVAYRAARRQSAESPYREHSQELQQRITTSSFDDDSEYTVNPMGKSHTSIYFPPSIPQPQRQLPVTPNTPHIFFPGSPDLDKKRRKKRRSPEDERDDESNHEELSRRFSRVSVASPVLTSSDAESNDTHNLARGGSESYLMSSRKFSSPRLSRRPPKSWQSMQVLGRGTYGCVHKTFVGGSFMAVKVLDLAGVDHGQVKALMREVELMKELSQEAGHPNIVRYYGCRYSASTNQLNIFMECMEQGSLGALVRSLGEPMEEHVAIEFTIQIVEGVRYLHSQDIIHRDLKGDNILIGADSSVKLSDFGTVRKLQGMGRGGDCSPATSMAGTPLWMAPEVVQCENYDFKVDIWGVGCVVCEMVAGQPPWPQYETVWQAMRVIGGWKEDFPPQMPKVPSVSPLCEDFLKNCLHVNPAMRRDAASLQKHSWLHSSPSPDEMDTESDDESGMEHLKYLRSMSEPKTPKTPVGRNLPQFQPPKRRGRLSCAHQLQMESLLGTAILGEPSVALRATRDSSCASPTSLGTRHSTSNCEPTSPISSSRSGSMVRPASQQQGTTTSTRKAAAASPPQRSGANGEQEEAAS